MNKPGKGLNKKMRRFCKHYALSLDRTDAYLKVYNCKSRHTARSSATKLLSKSNIQKYIKDLNNNISESLEISKQKIVMEFAKLAFANLGDYFNEYNDAKKLSELTRDQTAALQEIQPTTKIIFEGSGKDRTEVGELETLKLKIHDKSKNLLELARMLGFDEPIKIDMEVTSEKQYFFVNGKKVYF